MTNMKVAMYYRNNDVRIEEQTIPTITPSELLIKVKASGICGSDVMEWYRIKKAPRVLGHEITGDIEKVGSNITNFTKGDRVFISHHVPCNTCRYCLADQHTLCHTLHSTNFFPGGFAEYLRVPSINVDRGTFKLPDTVTYHEGVFIEPLACVIRGMQQAQFSPGQTIAIFGSGMSGLLHVLLAKKWGAQTIFTTDIEQYKLSTAKKCGADYTINAKENVTQEIKKHNNSRLADLVVISTGAPQAIQQALHCVEPGGTILFFAPPEPSKDVPMPMFDLWNKGVTLVSTYAGSPKNIVQAIDLLQSKHIDVNPLITHVLPLEKAQEGFSLVASGKKSIKIILEP